jgi:ABC-type uncharacterized transport system substrate-binding protein
MVRLGFALATMGLASGCEQRGAVTLVPKTATPKNLGKIVVIRLGTSAVEEPLEKDLRDGLTQESLVDQTSYSLETLDAAGDATKLPSLLEEALQTKPALVLTLTAESTLAAAEKIKDIPIVGYTGLAPPSGIGLVQENPEPAPKISGVFCPMTQSGLVSMACDCLPKDKRRFGVVFNPDDPVSVAIKDSLNKADRGVVSVPPTFETAEVRSASDNAPALQSLAKRQVAAIVLVPGRAIDDGALIQEATRAKIPVFGYNRAQAVAGAVLVRVPGLRWGGFETGRRAGQVLKAGASKVPPPREGANFLTIANPPAAKNLDFKIRGEFLRDAEILH